MTGRDSVVRFNWVENRRCARHVSLAGGRLKSIALARENQRQLARITSAGDKLGCR